jgi:hypothetical protein
MGVSGQQHAPTALYLRSGPTLPIGQKARWASELVWAQTSKKNPLSLPSIEPRRSRLYSDTILSELPRLLVHEQYHQISDLYSYIGPVIQC